MAFPIRALTMAAGLASLLVAAALPAQAQNQQQPPYTVTATFGDWEQRCVDRTDGRRTCALVQVGTSTHASGARALMTIARGGEGGQQMVARFQVPIGVYLPNGLSLSVDGKNYGTVPFQVCYPEGCSAIAVLNADQLGAVKSGNSAMLTIFGNPETPIQVPISLRGVTAGLAALG